MTSITSALGQLPLVGRMIDRGPAPDAPAATIQRAGLLGAAVVFAVMMILTLWAFHTVRTNSVATTGARFDHRHDTIVEAITNRMATYTHTLQGGLGLFKASDRVDRDEWRAYVATLDLNRLFPGIQGLGYAEWVKPGDIGRYEARIRAEGFPDFNLRPAGKRRLYSSITYLEPFDRRNRAAFGYDMSSEKTRRAAMLLARDTGEIAISGKVRLVQEISSDVQAGFLMYVPFYGPGTLPNTVEARRRTNIGFVYSAFRMRNLMEGILGPGLPDVRLRVYDGDSRSLESLMYDSDPRSAHAEPSFERVEVIDIGQRRWALHVSSLPSFETLLDPLKSYIILAGGLVTAFLFIGVLWSFATTRQRAQALADDMTEAVSRHSRELTRSNEELEQFAYVASHDLKAPLRGIDHLATWIEQDLGDRLDGESKKNMALMKGRIKRLEALLNDLLNYSRAGRMEAPEEHVDLDEMVWSIFDLLNSENRFTLVFSNPVEKITVRRTMLEQTLINLFSNAFKHHDAENGTIFVSVRALDARWYEFTVADDGPGISAEHRDRAFQMFQTLKPRDEVEGSGMGLAIIRKLVTAQGGEIRVEDRPGGRGALFRFTWPRNGHVSAGE